MAQNLPKRARFGRVVIDADGIRQYPVLFWFGRPFAIRWSEIRSWATTDTVAMSKQTRATQVIARMLELHHEGGAHIIQRPGNDPDYDRMVELVRQALPDRETQGLLAQAQALAAQAARQDAPPEQPR